jgi:protein-S-isoprenylcysteine O-methyltransferase Ste14
MVQTVAQIFGMAFVSIIMICIVWTVCSYIANGWEDKPVDKKNKKLWDNMNRMAKK